MHIFIDESGQFTKSNQGKYFVIGSFTCGDYRRTEKNFKKWQRTKFPRKMRMQAEIKFADLKVEKELRLKTIKFLMDLDIRIRYSYLLKQNIPLEYWKKNKLQSGHLYTNIIGETLESYLPIRDKEFRVFCDQRHLKGLKRSEFKNRLKIHLLPKLPAASVVQVEMIDSIKNYNIQIADWISGAIAAYLEDKELGAQYFEIMKNNIIEDGLELFKNY